MEIKFDKKIVINFLWFLGAVLILINGAFSNGYPIFFSDTGTYIYCGFVNKVPIDRPIFYPWFVRHISMSFSLWFVVIAQAMFVVFILLLLLKYLFKANYIFSKAFIVSVFLSLFTGITYFTSQLIPDIFAPLLFIGTAFIISEKQINKYLLAVLLILMVYASVVHFSNIIINLSVFLSVLTIFLILRKKEFVKEHFKRLILIFFIVVMPLLLIPTVNYIKGEGFKTSKVSNIFFSASLIESQILQEYLQNECDNKNWEICAYKDSFNIPAADFLWSGDSPLYLGGCNDKGWENCWISKNKVLGEIKNEILSTPKYQKMFIKSSIIKTFKQLVDFNIDSRGSTKSQFETTISKYYEDDIKFFKKARQYNYTLFFDNFSFIQYISVSLSFVFSIIILFFKPNAKKIPLNLKIFFIIILHFLVVNSMVCAVFSNVVSRYQGRLIWIIPMFFIMLLLNYKKFNLFENIRIKIKNYFS